MSTINKWIKLISEDTDKIKTLPKNSVLTMYSLLEDWKAKLENRLNDIENLIKKYTEEKEKVEYIAVLQNASISLKSTLNWINISLQKLKKIIELYYWKKTLENNVNWNKKLKFLDLNWDKNIDSEEIEKVSRIINDIKIFWKEDNKNIAKILWHY